MGWRWPRRVRREMVFVWFSFGLKRKAGYEVASKTWKPKLKAVPNLPASPAVRLFWKAAWIPSWMASPEVKGGDVLERAENAKVLLVSLDHLIVFLCFSSSSFFFWVFLKIHAAVGLAFLILRTEGVGDWQGAWLALHLWGIS